MVAEHGVGVDVDGEAGRELPHALDEPGAADVARHEVVVAFVDGVDERVSRGSHAPMVPQTGPRA